MAASRASAQQSTRLISLELIKHSTPNTESKRISGALAYLTVKLKTVCVLGPQLMVSDDVTAIKGTFQIAAFMLSWMCCHGSSEKAWRSVLRDLLVDVAVIINNFD